MTAPPSSVSPARDRYRRTAARHLFGAIEYLLDRLGGDDALGIPLCDTLPEEDETARAERVRAAMELIRDFDPNRFARIKRDLRRIFIARVVGAHFDPNMRSCFLPDPLRRSALQLAGTIVHEATHARISGCGIPYRPEVRARIEATCVHAAANFLSRVPGGSELAERELAALDAEPWYSEEKLAERKRRNEELVPVPIWIRRVLLFLLGY